MSESSQKARIIADLQQAQKTGELTAEKIREIVKTAISQGLEATKTGQTEIANQVQDAIAAVAEVCQDTGEELQAEMAAALEGAIAGISHSQRQVINQSQSQIQTLQTQVESQEQQLEQQINRVLQHLRDQGVAQSAKVKAAIDTAVDNFKETEEAALLQKRYAQLKAQLAVLQANLASRYGERYEEVKQYLDEAKNWYEKAKEDPEAFNEQVAQQRADFETKLGEAGGAIARKEKQVKQLLKELWQTVREIFK
ncbi:MAG TPA: histidine kinase [Xenococcaceae cyanobacterium]|jgi:predicted component of type VI protein secretion system